MSEMTGIEMAVLNGICQSWSSEVLLRVSD